MHEARALVVASPFGVLGALGALSPLGALGPKARLHAAGLAVAAVRAARDLAVGALPRQPDLNVVGLSGREAHVDGRQHHAEIWEAERLQHSPGTGRDAPHRIAQRLPPG